MRRLREWAQARLDAAILPVVQRCVADAAQPIDYQRLALEVACLKEFSRELVQAVSSGVRIDVLSDLAERVADEIDVSDVASHIAGQFDAEDVAQHMDAEDVAAYVDVDTDDIARRIADEIDVSDCVDYDKLAEALVGKLKEAWA